MNNKKIFSLVSLGLLILIFVSIYHFAFKNIGNESQSAAGVLGVTNGPYDYEQIIVYGQSRSNGAVSGYALTTSQPYGNLIYDYTISGLRTLAEGQIPGYGGQTESIGTAMSNFLSANGGQKYVVNHAGCDGQSLATLSDKIHNCPNGPGYPGLMGIVNGTKNKLDAQGKTSAVTAITWQQGEADALASTNYNGNDRNNPNQTYLNGLKSLRDNLVSDIQANTGQTRKPIIFLDQIASETGYSPSIDATSLSVAMQQWKIADQYSDQFVLVGPTYQNFYMDFAHMEAHNYRTEGSKFGEVMKKVLIDRQPWTPLKPRSITISGNIVTAQFWVPVGSLQITSQNSQNPYDVPDHTGMVNGVYVNKGFEFVDGSLNPATITNVAVTSPDTVTLTLSKVPTGPAPHLRYAYSGNLGQHPGVNQNDGVFTAITDNIGGNLHDTDTTLDPFTNNPMRNYAVRFDATLPFSAAASLASDLGIGPNPSPSPTPPTPIPTPLTPSPTPVTPTPSPLPGGTIGFNFVASLPALTDASGNIYVTCGDKYPTTRAGVTFGWETSSINCFNQSTADTRISGGAYNISGNQTDIFRVDLSAGTYAIRSAQGDINNNNHQSPALTIEDSSTPVLTLPAAFIPYGTFLDAAGGTYSISQWPSQNQAVQKTFNSNIARVVLQSNTPSTVNTISYISFSKINSSTPSSSRFSPNQRVQTTSNLNVRSTPSVSGILLGTQSSGSLGTISSGGQSADGYYWWNVNYDFGSDGYSIEDYLQNYLAPVVPAPSPVTPPPVAPPPTAPPSPTPTPPPVIPPTPPSTTGTTYSASADFSSIQGDHNWSYLYNNQPMIFNTANNWWKGGEQYSLIWDNGGHPGNFAEVTRRWTAPAAGTALISGTAAKQDTTGGNGVNVYIRKNGISLWSTNISYNNSTGQNFNLSVSVNAGDTIDFTINSNGDWGNDTTLFSPTIVFSPGISSTDPSPAEISITIPPPLPPLPKPQKPIFFIVRPG